MAHPLTNGVVTGIQDTLQRVCQQLVRRKTSTSQVGEARRTSASNRQPQQHNGVNLSAYIKSDLKMPVTVAGLLSGEAGSVVAPEHLVTRCTSTGVDDVTEALNRQANKKKIAAVLPASPTATPAKKSPSAKKMGTAEDYHTVLLNNRTVVVPVIPDRLYLGRLQDVPMPRVSDVAVFFSTDDEYAYENFFDDFGPLNIGNVYRYCKKIEK